MRNSEPKEFPDMELSKLLEANYQDKDNLAKTLKTSTKRGRLMISQVTMKVLRLTAIKRENSTSLVIHQFHLRTRTPICQTITTNSRTCSIKETFKWATNYHTSQTLRLRRELCFLFFIPINLFLSTLKPYNNPPSIM